MEIVKSKLRKKNAIPIIGGILAACYGMKWCGETPTKITILPEMMRWFNVSMYVYV